jgi:hypothetical protein
MGTERELLLGWLAFHRDALAANCEGVSPEDLVRTGLGGSTMSLLGLVRHLTEMERSYLVTAIGGGQLVTLYGPYEDGRPEGDFDGLTPALVEPSFAAWYAERAHSDRLIEQHPSLDDTGPDSDRSVRAGLLMVIQEYARHNGHADLMRQSIDGARGE